MTRTALLICGLSIAIASLPGAAEAKTCKAAITATGHGQAVEPSLPDYGVPYARKDARKHWRAAVIAADGLAYANLVKARNITYSEDRGAGQIYITLTARPCK